MNQYPYYDHDADLWAVRMWFVGVSLIGILLILWGCYHIPQENEDQFWNVFILGSVTWMILVTAWVQIGVNRSQWKAMRDALDRTDTLIEQNKSIIKATQRQALAAERTLKQTKEHFRLTERPVLGFEEISAVMMANKVGGVVGILVNSGKMPAKIISQVRGYGYLEIKGDINELDDPPAELPPVIEVPGTAAIHIGGRREVHFCSISAEDWGSLKAERLVLFIYTKFIYRGLTDTTEFILEHYSAYNPRSNIFVQMRIRNEVT